VIGLLISLLERLPPGVRRLTVVVGALLAVGAVMSAQTMTTPGGGHEPGGGHVRQGATRRRASAGVRHGPRRLPPPVSVAQLLSARAVAERFLASYLRFAYGRGSAPAVSGVTPVLSRQLAGQRAQPTPVERRRRPRVVSLQTLGTTPTFVVATAVIEDGGVTVYQLRFTPQHGPGGWAVSGVEEG